MSINTALGRLEELEGTKKVELLAKATQELKDERLRQSFAEPGGLYRFVKFFWDIVEPSTPMKESWAAQTICLHLEAVEHGLVRRLLINCPPGSAKSLLTSVFYPLWCWSAKNKPSKRFLNLSYSAALPERDNRKMLLIIRSEKFQRLYGDRFKMEKDGQELIENDKTGFKQAAGILGSVTGRRADAVIIDDPNAIPDAELSNHPKEHCQQLS